MAKKVSGGGTPINLTNLWGKPLHTQRESDKSTDEKVTGTMTDSDDVMDDDDIDVDAELERADEDADEAVDELAEIEAEDTSEITDDDENGDEDEKSEDADDEEPSYEDAEEETVVTAVVDDDEDGDEETVSETHEDDVVMSEKMSLSDHVRAEITRRHKAGDSLRGKDIVEALAKKKIKVSPAQVSQLLKKAGLGGGKPGRPKAATGKAPAAPVTGERAALKAKKRTETPVKAPAAAPAAQPRQALKARNVGNGFKVPMSQLQAAEAFVEACGGSFKTATHILTAAEQLSQTFGA
jgi:hypothetical protein